MKDKLFYFLNYEGMRRNFPLIANISAAGNSLFDTTGKLLPTSAWRQPRRRNAAPPLPSWAVNSRPCPAPFNQDLGFGKLDWRPTERNSFSASLNVLRWVSPNGLQTAGVLNNGTAWAETRILQSAPSTDDLPGRRSHFRNASTNSASDGSRTNSSTIPTTLWLSPASGSWASASRAKPTSARLTDYPRTNPSENRYQLADSYTMTKGKHTLKVGFEFMRTEDYTNLLFNRTGTYTFPSFTALAQDFTGNAAGNKDWQTFTQTIGNPIVDLFIKDYSFFVQDQFKVTPRLTLNIGVRYDYSALPQPTLTNPDYPATGRIPTYNKEFAPRIGFAYSLDRSR